MTRTTLIGLLMMFSCIIATSVMAGDEALYEKDPPPNAAFFRILNASENEPLEVKMAGERIVSVQPLSVTSYGFSETTSTHFSLNDTPVKVDTKPGSMTTLVWDGKSPSTIGEEMFSSKKKARLKLFNIGGETVDLTTVDKKTKVIEAVEAGQYGFRDVNALSIPLSIAAADTSLLTTEEIALKKGMVTSIFFIKNGSTPLYVKAEEQR